MRRGEWGEYIQSGEELTRHRWGWWSGDHRGGRQEHRSCGHLSSVLEHLGKEKKYRVRHKETTLCVPLGWLSSGRSSFLSHSKIREIANWGRINWPVIVSIGLTDFSLCILCCNKQRNWLWCSPSPDISWDRLQLLSFNKNTKHVLIATPAGDNKKYLQLCYSQNNWSLSSHGKFTDVWLVVDLITASQKLVSVRLFTRTSNYKQQWN